MPGQGEGLERAGSEGIIELVLPNTNLDSDVN